MPKPVAEKVLRKNLLTLSAKNYGEIAVFADSYYMIDWSAEGALLSVE